MTKKSRVGLIIGLVLVLVAATGYAVKSNADRRAALKKKPERPPLEFMARDIVQLTPRVLSSELVLPGSVQAVSQATVRSKLSAEVQRVRVREGERVSVGQIIVELDTAQLKTQLAERTATLESAKAQLAQTERTRQANAQLVRQNFISQNAFDTADSAHRAQAAAVEAAQAQLAQTMLLLGDAVVRAPIAGIVAKRHVQPGEKVSFDAPLVAIVDLTQLEVQAQAPVSDVALLERETKVEVEVEGLAGRTFAGRVDRINPSTEPGTRTIHVYVAIANEDSLLKAGMFARARMQVQRDQRVPSLPMTAVQSDAGQPVVWTIADGKLLKRAVTLGRRDERAQLVEIVSGVGPSEQVIATKFDNLRDGLVARIVGGSSVDAPVAGNPPRVAN